MELSFRRGSVTWMLPVLAYMDMVLGGVTLTLSELPKHGPRELFVKQQHLICRLQMMKVKGASALSPAGSGTSTQDRWQVKSNILLKHILLVFLPPKYNLKLTYLSLLNYHQLLQYPRKMYRINLLLLNYHQMLQHHLLKCRPNFLLPKLNLVLNEVFLLDHNLLPPLMLKYDLVLNYRSLLIFSRMLKYVLPHLWLSSLMLGWPPPLLSTCLMACQWMPVPMLLWFLMEQMVHLQMNRVHLLFLQTAYLVGALFLPRVPVVMLLTVRPLNLAYAGLVHSGMTGRFGRIRHVL
eukprot:s1726_g4.t1